MNEDKYWAKEDAKELVDCLDKKKYDLEDHSIRNLLHRNESHYYNNDTLFSSETALDAMGDSGEFVRVNINQARSLIRSMVTLVSSERLSFETLAMSNDETVFVSTSVAKAIIDDVVNRKNVDKLQDEAVEMSLVYGSSFYQVVWNTALGEPWIADEKGETFFTGDIDIRVKSPNEVFFNKKARSWDEVDWILVRQRMNKWTLASQYKKYKDDLVELNNKEVLDNSDEAFSHDDDMIDVWEWYHKPTPALPKGRMVVYASNEIILFDGDNPYECLPIIPVIPMPYGQSQFGYALYSDLLPAQEMLDNEISCISSNHSAYGVSNILVPDDSDMDVEDLQGMRFIRYNSESQQKPEPLNLAYTSPELFRMVEILKANMMELSGINSSVRGNPPTGVTSGVAVATLSANALKFASPFQKANQIALENVMKKVVEFYKLFANAERSVPVMGANGAYQALVFSNASIEDIERIKIRPRNPLADTLSGRVEIAQNLLNSGLIANPQDYLRIVQHGELDELVDEQNTETELIEAENDQLRQGNRVQALMTDDHVKHLSKHKTLLNSPIIRKNSEVVPLILEHIQEHMNMLRDGDPVMLELAMTDSVSPETIMNMQKPVTANVEGGLPPPQPIATNEAAAEPTSEEAEPLPLETPLN